MANKEEDKYNNRRFDSAGIESIDREILETVKYEYPGRNTKVEFIYPEFTSVCPWTGLPDFGTLEISFYPSNLLVELKSLKYYLNSYRNVGILQEHVVNRILDDLVNLLEPSFMRVKAEFAARGGIKTVVKAKYPQ